MLCSELPLLCEGDVKQRRSGGDKSMTKQQYRIYRNMHEVELKPALMKPPA